MVKACKKEFDAAQSKSNAQAQFMDQKHITEAQIQAGKFKANTMAELDKGEKLEQDRLKGLEQAVADQKAVMAQRALDCVQFLKSIDTVVTQLEALTHLKERAQSAESLAGEPAAAASTPAQPAADSSLGVIAPPDAEKLTAFHELLVSANLPPDVAKQIRDRAAAAYQPASLTNSYGKENAGGPAHAAPNRPLSRRIG